MEMHSDLVRFCADLMAALSPAARELLGAAAYVGRRFRLSQLQTMGMAVRRGVAEPVVWGFLQQIDNNTLEFTHEIVRAAAVTLRQSAEGRCVGED